MADSNEAEIIVEQKFEPRNCMGHCGKKFVPLAKHNHVCPQCTNINSGINDRSYRVVRKFRE